MNRRNNGDHFTILPHKPPPHKITKEQVWEETRGLRDEVPGFQQFQGLHPKLVESLETNGFRRPTYVQRESIPTLLSGESSIVSSETGNGKTLAYLVPVLQQILESKYLLDESKRPYNSPLAVIIAPSRELAKQIYVVASDLCHGLGIKTRMEHGGGIKRKILTGRRGQVDLLVGSMGGISKMFHHKLFLRGHVGHIVYDEADTLLVIFYCRISRNFTHISLPHSRTIPSVQSPWPFCGGSAPASSQTAAARSPWSAPPSPPAWRR